jgi:anti-sigma B factor antagonist
MELGLSHEVHDGGFAVVKVVGEVDVYTFPEFRDYLLELLEGDSSPQDVGLDLSAVTWFDSTALGVIVGFLARCRKASPPRGVYAVTPADQAMKTLRITGLTKVFPVVGSVEEFLDLAKREREAEAPAPEVEEECA